MLRRPLPAVLLLWCAAAALVGPGGNFPLSDDWAYAHLVRGLCEGRGYDPLPWTGASVVVQALYGAAVCAVRGFSYEDLRWTTLAMSLVGIVSFHGLLRELGAQAVTAAAGAAVLALSPLWFNQSFTFMTDVPFAALSLLSAWLYVRALRDGSSARLLVAGAAAAAAFLVRQHALSIAVAAAVAAVWPLRGERRRTAGAAVALALPLAAFAAYATWAATAAEVPLAVRNKLGEAISVAPLAMAGAGFRALATLGFLFLPWAIAARPRDRSMRAAFAASFALLSAVAAFLYAREGGAMFYLTNVLGDFTLGALTTRDVLFLARPLAPQGGAIFHLVLTFASLAGAAVLVAHAFGFARRAAGLSFGPSAAVFAEEEVAPRAALFCWLALALSAAGTLLQAHYYFDRYVLVLLPLSIAAVTASAGRIRFGAGPAALWAVLAVYAVTGTHDYLAWNRARWSLLDSLEARGVTARQIDGGFEYNADRLAAGLRSAPSDAEARSGQDDSAKSWWWVEDDEWVVAFGALDGYAEADSREFPRWLPPRRGRVLLLHRAPAVEPR